MKHLERLGLVDRIGRELQAKMSYADIATYLQAFGVNTEKQTSGVNSKWVYTKELLADASAETVLRIADELGVPHAYIVKPSKEVVESSFWEPLHFRLFLTHLASFKKPTAALQAALRSYGISGFVAHVDIDPTKEWQDEIESALQSMDALAAILMPGFKESNWTDQEVGVAVGRGVLVIPIIRGLDPYGFIGKFQGLHAEGKTVAQVAKEVFEIIVASPRTRSRMLSCLVDTTVRATSQQDALEKVAHLETVRDIPVPLLERLRDGAATTTLLSSGKPLANVNALLGARGVAKVPTAEPFVAADDDVPF